jgi:hypothetical protein
LSIAEVVRDLHRSDDQYAVDGLRSTRLIDARHGGDLAGQAFKGGLIKLTLGVALLALVVAAVQVAHDFGNRQEVAGVDLLFIFLRAARPHRALDLGLALQGVQRLGHHVGGREGAHADVQRLVGGDAQGHLVLLEGDDEKLQLNPGDLLFLDRDDPADAMRRVDHEIVRAEFRLLRLGHSVFPRRKARSRDKGPARPEPLVQACGAWIVTKELSLGGLL